MYIHLGIHVELLNDVVRRLLHIAFLNSNFIPIIRRIMIEIECLTVLGASTSFSSI